MKRQSTSNSPDSKPTLIKKKKFDDSLESEQDFIENKERELNGPDDENKCKRLLETVRKCYKFEIPNDFKLFWEFCCDRNRNNPKEALKSTLGLILVGPFDVMDNPKFSEDEDISWLLHYRYFFDPPEFTTVIIKHEDKKLGHWGYVRDAPSELPALVAFNEAAKNGRFSTCGDNIFASVFLYAKSLPEKPGIKSLMKDLEDWAQKHNFSLLATSEKIRARNKKSVTKTFSGLGLVVPVSDDDVGYRPLPESLSSLHKILEKISSSKNEDQKLKASQPLDEIMTYIQFANDEGDFGEGVELGLDLFAFEKSEVFTTQIEMLLSVGYQLLGYDLFAEIIKLHLKKRVRGGRVSKTWGRS